LTVFREFFLKARTTVFAFDFLSVKTVNFRPKISFASRLDTAGVIKLQWKNDTVRKRAAAEFGALLI
jgi:hypothetical protein